jgi:hypothetical protein
VLAIVTIRRRRPTQRSKLPKDQEERPALSAASGIALADPESGVQQAGLIEHEINGGTEARGVSYADSSPRV